MGVVITIEETLKKSIPNSPPPAIQQMSSPLHKNIKSKLPKLQVRKFSGRLQVYQDFLDSFQSSIDENESLSAVEKFSYLKSLLYERARSMIAGFALTGANYTAGVQVPKKRYGKEVAIQRAHMNDLLQFQPVFSDKDIPKLRKFFDN